MVVDDAARHQLYTSLQATLGPEPTSILMSLLPPVGWADVATRQDLTTLEHGVRTEMAEMRGQLRAEMAELRSETSVGMAEVRTELADAMRRQTVALVGVMVTLYGIAWATITFGG